MTFTSRMKFFGVLTLLVWLRDDEERSEFDAGDDDGVAGRHAAAGVVRGVELQPQRLLQPRVHVARQVELHELLAGGRQRLAEAPRVVAHPQRRRPLRRRARTQHQQAVAPIGHAPVVVRHRELQRHRRSICQSPILMRGVKYLQSYFTKLSICSNN
jgi:hypothetical protein